MFVTFLAPTPYDAPGAGGEMTGWRMGWLLGVVLLVACTEGNRGRMSEEQKDAAVRPWLECAFNAIGTIDDRSESAAVVASAVRARCHRFWLGSPELELPLILDTVLQIRAKQSQASRPTGAARDVAAPLRAAASPTPMRRSGGIYVVPVTINKAITLDFALDSGASDVSIPLDVVLALVRAGTIRQADIIGDKTYVLADGSRTKAPTFRIRSLTVGDRTVENVLGSVAPTKGTPLLGQSFLGRFRSWSIDNTRHALVLE